MTRERWMITSLLTLAMPLALAACDGDDDGGDEAADSGSESETGGETDEGDETLGRTDADVGADSMDGSDFGEAESGEPTGCAALTSETDCNAMQGCASVHGNAILDDGQGGWCTAADDEFIGCVETGNLCPPLPKTLCGGEQMWTTTDCVPENLMVCDPPGDITGPCE
jgi:hypothetical protein